MGALKKFLSAVLAIHALVLVSAWPAMGVAAERWATLADTVFQHLARDNELPSYTVPTALAEDAEGFLWVGTENGLARWDGYQFRLYKSDPSRPGSLPDSFIKTLHTDGAGRLWIGTSSGGLARYDNEHDRFVTYPAGRDGLSHVNVRGIEDDGAGGLWVGTDGGLDHLNPGTGTILHLRHDERVPGSLPDSRVRTLLRDRSGALWIGTLTGLVRRESGTARLVPIVLPTPDGKGASPWSFYEASDGRIWIGTLRNGAYVIEPKGTIARAVHETDARGSTLETEGVHAIVEVRNGTLWLGTLGHGIVEIDAASSQTRRIRHDPTLPQSLTDDTVQALHKDRSGLIWICTDRAISRHDPQQPGVYTVFGASSRQDGISENNVDAVLELPDGRIWIGLDARGIEVLDPSGGRIAALRPDPSHPANALPNDYVNAFAATPSGDVFVGTEQGLYRVNRSAAKRSEAARVDVAGHDPTAGVWTLLLDHNVLWVGGLEGLWPLSLNGADGARALSPASITGLTDERVTVIAAGPGGSLWVGTKNGLNLLDPTSRSVQHILPDPADVSALGAGYITTLLTDRRGRLWVGTLGGGISVLDKLDAGGAARFHRLGLAQGLGNDDVNKLLEDVNGRIWASTDNGLALIDPETFAIRTLLRAEGVAITNYWVGAGTATSAGELLFGGVGGLTVVRPDRVTAWSYRPPVVVTDVRIGGRRVPAGRFNTAVGGSERNPGGAEPLSITPGSHSLAVEFSALDYSAPERNRYQYKLEGFDPDWIETESSRRLASYTNLPPGDYSLRLRGSNRDGLWSQTRLSVPIRVLPAWYQTLGFRLLLAFAFLILIAGVVHVRTLYLRRAHSELEREVIARTAELRESQRQLEQIAYCDTLTALPNRRMFMEEFRELLVLAGLQGGRFALLLIDLDRLKQINDTLGHDVGDALLIETGLRLQSAVRKSDVVARLGGDEFAVLITHNPAASDIEGVCKRILDSFAADIAISTARLRATPSIGVAVYPDHGTTHDRLYKSADVALYEAKRAGGNRWCWSGRNRLASESA
jgi:diguanylate cyclase (GGDEF)-like protein